MKGNSNTTGKSNIVLCCICMCLITFNGLSVGVVLYCGPAFSFNVLTLLVEFIKLGDLFSSSSTTAGLLCEQAL